MPMKNDYDIAQIYKEMELHLIRSMQRNLGRHLKDEVAEGKSWKMWQTEKLKELKRYQRQNKDILGAYTSGLDKEIADILKEEFRQGHKSELNKYNKLFDKKISDSFFKLDDRKANVLIDVVNNDLNEANKAVLRMMNDTYRQTIHKAATFANTGVMTQKQAVDMATKDFLSRGLAVIEYKDGKRVNIASYAQMAVRTASQRAMLMGEGEFRKEIGETLVIISKHGTACKLCQPHESQVYVDDVYSGGKSDGKHKLLSDAMKQGLFHPNCRHGISTYYGLDDEDEEETTVNVPEENNNEDAARLDREIQKEKRKIAGFQSPDNLKTAQQRLRELEDQKHDNVLRYYVSGDGMYINNALRGVNDVVLNDNDMRYIKDLDNALNSKLKTNMTVYRNVDATAIFGNMSETDFENLQNKLIYNSNDRFANAAADKYLGNIKGKVITDKGYLSTTKDYEIARDWGDFTGSDKPIVLELEVPKGTKGRDLAKFDLEDDPQKEVLLARNTKYKINDVVAKDGNIYVKASVINDDVQDIVTKEVKAQKQEYVFKPAETLEEVTDRITNRLGNANIDLKKMNLGLANEYLEGIEKFTNEYPMIKDYLSVINTKVSSPSVLAECGTIAEKTISTGKTKVLSTELRFRNPKDIEKFNKTMEQAVKSKFHYENYSSISTAAHELTHGLEFLLSAVENNIYVDGNYLNEFTASLDNGIAHKIVTQAKQELYGKQFGKDVYDNIAYLGKYSLTNAKETLAQAISYELTVGTNPYSAKIKELFDKKVSEVFKK